MNHNPHDGQQKASEQPKGTDASGEKQNSCLVFDITNLLKTRYPGGLNPSNRQEVRDAIAQVAAVVMSRSSDQEKDRFDEIMHKIGDEIAQEERRRDAFRSILEGIFGDKPMRDGPKGMMPGIIIYEIG